MVVTRRQSASPSMLPVTSRTNSSSGSPRPSKGKDPDRSSPLKNSGVSPSDVPPNGTPSSSPQVGPRNLEDIKFDDDPVPTKSILTKAPAKPKSKQKSKKSKSKKSHSHKGIRGFDILARIFLLWLTIYTVSVCPEDTQLRSPVCRALTEYRRVILEPYVYPPIRAALEHPSIAPHIQSVQPYYRHAVEVCRPWVHRGKRECRDRVIPKLHWLQLCIQPYFLHVEQQYGLVVRPFILKVSDAAWRFRLQAEPYALAAAIKSHRGWETAQPYLIPLWREVERLPGIVAVYVGGPLAQARRHWVDPQVTKIWDAVVENGKAGARVVPTASTRTATFGSASSTLASSGPSTSTAISTISKSSLTSAAQSSTGLPTVVDYIPDPSAESVPLVQPLMSEHINAPAASTIMESALTYESQVASEAQSTMVFTRVHDTLASSAPPSESKASMETNAGGKVTEMMDDAENIQPLSAITLKPTSELDGDDEDLEDLDAFLAELDADDVTMVAEQLPPQPSPSEEHEETQEELEERLRRAVVDNADMRAEIEARHAQWELEVERVGKAQRKAVRETLKILRDAASQLARAPDGPVRAPIASLVQEAERSLKSLKSYARKLAAEDKPEKEKVKNWESVVQKADKKFGERVDSAAQSIKAWWDVQIELEGREIANIAAQVELVAERAQDDLGLNYAWLPGVTFDDWQRYHKLADTSKAFHEWYIGMQNGTVLNAPPDPVADIMEAVQEEVDDMILGFDANLGRIKTAAIGSFSALKASDDARDIPDVAESSGQEAGAPVLESVPEASILPIDPVNAKKAEAVPPVILNRGVEEIMSAASRAEEVEKKMTTHAEL